VSCIWQGLPIETSTNCEQCGRMPLVFILEGIEKEHNMNFSTLIIIALAAVVLASIGKVQRASQGSNNPDIILNRTTLVFVGCVGIAILLGIAALSAK
jgi:hypothetical protein